MVYDPSALMRELSGLNQGYQSPNPATQGMQQRLGNFLGQDPGPLNKSSYSGPAMGPQETLDQFNARLASQAAGRQAGNAMLNESGLPIGNAAIAKDALSQLAQEAPQAAPSTAEEMLSQLSSGGGAIPPGVVPEAVAGGEAAAAGGGTGFLAGRLLPGAGLATGGLMLGGAMKHYGVDQNDPSSIQSNLARVAGDTTMGAGVGAGIGKWIPGIGVPIGATLGATAGAGYSIYDNIKTALDGGNGGGGSKAKKVDPLTTAISQSGLSLAEQKSLNNQYQTLMQLAGDDKARKVAKDSIQQQLIARMQAAPQEAAAQQNALATQAMIGQYMQPAMTQMQKAGQAHADQINQLAADLPPQYRAIAKADAANQIMAGNDTAQQYGASMQAMPQILAIQQQQQLINQIAQQQYAKMIANQNGGNSDLNSAIAQATGG